MVCCVLFGLLATWLRLCWRRLTLQPLDPRAAFAPVAYRDARGQPSALPTGALPVGALPPLAGALLAALVVHLVWQQVALHAGLILVGPDRWREIIRAVFLGILSAGLVAQLWRGLSVQAEPDVGAPRRLAQRLNAAGWWQVLLSAVDVHVLGTLSMPGETIVLCDTAVSQTLAHVLWHAPGVLLILAGFVCVRRVSDVPEPVSLAPAPAAGHSSFTETPLHDVRY